MEEIRLDMKDGKILQALEQNGRAMIKEISKKTGIPPDSVNYRIKKMVKSKVIKNFAPICDTYKLGYPLYVWVHFTLQNFDKVDEENFKNYLSGLKNTVYIAKVTGRYHYILNFAAKSIEGLDNILRGILSRFPNLIKDYHTSLMVSEVKYDTFYKLIE